MPEIITESRSQRDQRTQIRKVDQSEALKSMGSRVARERPTVDAGTPQEVQGDQNEQQFDLLMAMVYDILLDMPHETVESVAMSIAETLQDETLTVAQKKTEVEDLVGPVSNEKFNDFVNIVQKLAPALSDGYSRGQDSSVAVVLDENSFSSSDDDEDIIAAPTQKEDENGVIEEDEHLITTPGSVSPDQIHAHWLSRLLEPTKSSAKKVLSLLQGSRNEVETRLLDLFHNEHVDLVKVLVDNKDAIFWLTKFYNAQDGQERRNIAQGMEDSGLAHLLKGRNASLDNHGEKGVDDLETLDLEGLTFRPGSKLLIDDKVTLPEGSVRTVTKTYEQYDVPHTTKPSADIPLVSVTSLPPWCRPAFLDLKNFNKVQSNVFATAFESDENILMCAPTGAGKTNVALMALLRCIQHYKNDGGIDLANFKMIYVSPLKALVQEQVREFSKRLEYLGIKVAELSGDSHLTSSQLAGTNLIITTPEKWDVVTRKSSDVGYTSLVRLVVIDEIHLLTDDRGPAIENIIARIQANAEKKARIRLVGLSATLPNYRDIAHFLNADNGCFYFDSSYRPIPLNQSYLGMTEKSAIKRYNSMNEACYQKALELAGQHQLIIFAHSRNDTFKTARHLLDRAQEDSQTQVFASSIGHDLPQVSNINLQELLPHGLAIHHAGLSRQDRMLVETLFSERKIRVLVSTATLAWGVNLPAHVVIVKGTQIYKPDVGAWEELPPQDVLQMLGRAGRPGFDTVGLGMIMTTHEKLSYYMSIMTASFPIESQLISKLLGSVNAECNSGLIYDLESGVRWLKCTYYYTRMQRNPDLYRVMPDPDGKSYENWCRNVMFSAFRRLEELGLLTYDRTLTSTKSNKTSKIAADFYISPESISVYTKQLKPYLTFIDIFRVFSRSEEFRYIPIRQEEKVELSKLMDNTPVPVIENVTDPIAKVNVLLQAYISRLALRGFVLSADMVYVSQSAGRLFRAMYEIALEKRFASLAILLLDICKAVDRRMWLSNTPLRQFANMPAEVIQKTESSYLPWERYFDLESPIEVGQAIRSEDHGKLVFDTLGKFPRFGISAHYQPLTSTMLRVTVDIEMLFTWDHHIHGSNEPLVLLVQDSDGDYILYSYRFTLSRANASQPKMLQFVVPITDPLPPAYIVTILSERWLGSRTDVALLFGKLILPPKSDAPTVLRLPDQYPALDMGKLSVEQLNPYQLQVADTLLNSETSAFIGLSENEGKAICGEIVLSSYLGTGNKVLYLGYYSDGVDLKYSVWKKRFPGVGRLTDNLTTNLELINESEIIMATAAQWEYVSRRWAQYKMLQQLDIVICDDLHYMGSLDGHLYEIVIARMKFMATQLSKNIRFIGFSIPVTCPSVVGSWLGASKSSILNFAPSARANDVNIRVRAFDQHNYTSKMIVMSRAAHKTVDTGYRTLVIVPDRSQCIKVAGYLIEMMGLGTASDIKYNFQDRSLASAAGLGVPFIYEGMDPTDKAAALAQDSKLLLVTRAASVTAPQAPSVIILNTEYFDELENEFVDYTAADVLRMVSLATRDAYIFTNSGKSVYYTKFLNEPIPLESNLNFYLRDIFMTEIAIGAISCGEDALDWLTYTYSFRRLPLNPMYYDLQDASEDEVNSHLSELLESALEDLQESDIITISDPDTLEVKPRNEALIASRFNISFTTIVLLGKLGADSRLRDILQTVCEASEFDMFGASEGELATLRKLEYDLPFRYVRNETNDTSYIPHLKVFVLLQCYISRVSVPPRFQRNIPKILVLALNILEAAINLLCGNGHLSAVVAIDLHQMLVQGLWTKDSVLKQVPHMDEAAVQRANVEDVNTVYDLVSVEDDNQRNEILGFDEADERMAQVAEFVNKYPIIDISATVTPESSPGHAVVKLEVEREIDEDSEFSVESSRLPLEKAEQWYVLVGSTETRELYGARKISIAQPNEVFDIPVFIPTPGTHRLKVWCLCDGYLGVDKEVTVDFAVSHDSETKGS